VQIHALLTPPDEAFAYARLSDTLDLRPFPQTLRRHIGARELGDFGTVLMAERPASDGLSARVERWRTIDAAARDDLPLRAHPDHTAEDRNFNFIYVALPIAIMCWVIIGLVAAWLKGAL
jgi:hypothetical protein